MTQSARLNEHQVRVLLDVLCTELGFCLPRVEVERLANEPPTEVITLTDAVFRLEGLDPEWADRHLYRRVLAVVTRAFEHALDDEVATHVKLTRAAD